MKSSVDLISEPGGSARVRETADLLLMFKSRPDVDWQVVLPDLPKWLTDAFAPERNAQQVAEWRAELRAAPDPLALERERGWTASGWLYWFSSSNDFWSIDDAVVSDDGLRVTVQLEHEDYTFPMEALRWLAIKAGMQSSDEI